MGPEDHPIYQTESETVRAALRRGVERSEVITALLREGYSSTIVVRALRDGLPTDLGSARREVASVVADDQFERMWQSAENALGRTVDDALAYVDNQLASADVGRLATASDLQWDDIVDTIVVERIRAFWMEHHDVAWFRAQLARLRRQNRPGGALLVCVALDRLGCPAEFVPDLLDASVALDASSCRIPIATIARTRGLDELVQTCERLRRSADPGDIRGAEQIEYQLNWLRLRG